MTTNFESAPGKNETNSETSLCSSDEIANTIANKDTLTKIFIADITSRVTEAIIQREDRRQRNWSIIFAVLGLILAAGAFTSVQILVKNSVAEALEKQEETVQLFVEDSVKNQLNDSIGEVTEEIKFQEIYQQLTYLAFSLDFKDSFSNEERDLVMTLLKKIAGRPELENRDDFPNILDKLLDSFVSAGLDHHVDEIVSLYEREIFESTSMSQTVCHHYGRRLIVAEVLQNEDLTGLRDRFNKIAENAEKIRYSEYCKPFQLVDEYTRDPDDTDKHIANLFAQVEFFSPQEQSVVIATLFQHRKSLYYQKKPDYESTIINPKFDAFFLAYNDQLYTIASKQDVSTELLKKIDKSSVDDFKDAVRSWLENQTTSGSTTTAGGLEATAPIQDSSIRIMNASESTICYVQISPASSDSWGEDWLGNDKIPPGESYSFDLTSGKYDLRLTDCDGNELLEEADVNIHGLFELEFNPPENIS